MKTNLSRQYLIPTLKSFIKAEITFDKPLVNGLEVETSSLKIKNDKNLTASIETINYMAYGKIPTTAYAIEYKSTGDIKIAFDFTF